MDNFLAILNEVWINGLLGVSMTKIIAAIVILLLSFLLRGFVVTVVVSSIEKLAKSTESSLDDEILKAVKKPLSYVPVTIGIYIVTMILPLEGVAGDISSNIVKALIIFTIFSPSLKDLFILNIIPFAILVAKSLNHKVITNISRALIKGIIKLVISTPTISGVI